MPLSANEQKKEKPKVIDQTRKKRSDAGKALWTPRDIAALTQDAAHQYAMRLDQVQTLLSRLGNRPVRLSTTRALVTRWRNAGWVNSQRTCAHERVWVWPTQSALDLPYCYADVDRCSLGTLKMWAAQSAGASGLGM